MDRLVSTSLTAMRGAMARQTAIANNLANANTVGFRAEIANASTQYIDGQTFKTRAQQSEQVIAADMQQGAVVTTGNPLDVAMNGDALLSVQAANGDEAYTRRGDLKLSDSGLLTTGDGMPVIGDGGPITLPAYDKLTIAADGTISIVPQGGDPAQIQQVDRLKLVAMNGTDIAKGLDGLFRARNGGTLAADPEATVRQGALEGSNVNASATLIDMIEASRDWDMQVKMMSAAQDIDKASTSLMSLD